MKESSWPLATSCGSPKRKIFGDINSLCESFKNDDDNSNNDDDDDDYDYPYPFLATPSRLLKDSAFTLLFNKAFQRILQKNSGWFRLKKRPSCEVSFLINHQY